MRKIQSAEKKNPKNYLLHDQGEVLFQSLKTSFLSHFTTDSSVDMWALCKVAFSWNVSVLSACTGS